MTYVNIRVRKETYEKLKELAAGKPLVQFIDSLLENKPDEADVLVEQLDKENTWKVDPLLKGLGPDELPECCIEFIRGRDMCEHWEDRRPVGYWNKLTHKWANDPDYIQYV